MNVSDESLEEWSSLGCFDGGEGHPIIYEFFTTKLGDLCVVRRRLLGDHRQLSVSSLKPDDRPTFSIG